MVVDDTNATVLFSRDTAPRLVVQEGPQTGISFNLNEDQLRIGRGDDLEIVLQDPMTSRMHARVDWQDGQAGIEDLGSSNGTFVNNVQVTKRRTLNPGDRVLIGQTVLLFQTEAVQAETPTSEPTSQTTKIEVLKKPHTDRDVIPSRLMLTTASQANTRLGHENLGFLSETHGFLPTSPPLLKLPSGYEVWDEMAESLPELWRAIRIRQALQDMPVLSADKEELPDEYLLRASVIMSMLAHAYHRISDTPPDKPMPDGVQLPWEQITRRLERLAPHLSYIDLILYNWKLINPDLDDPIRLNNLELLVSTVDNQEERVLYLMQVEAHHKIVPLTGAMVRSQEAVYRDDVEALKKELIFITDGIQRFGHKIFMALNPNPYSDTFVDPVVWAKTVAPFAVPITEGTVGPSGVSAPSFHMLDIFFSRHHYNTHLGEEMLNMRNWYPKHWRDFFEALNEISVAEYVEKRGDPVLNGIYKEAGDGLCW